MPSPTRSSSRPSDLVLHIGSGKTGTTSIQEFLHRNRPRLADLGVLYPRTPGRRRHLRLSMFVQDDEALDRIPHWHRQRFTSPTEFRKAFRRRLSREIDRSGLSRVLLSDEGLYGSRDQSLRELHRLLDPIAGSLRVVVYLRRQDDHMVSRYQQVVKAGETRRLEVRTRELDLSKTYDYYARLRKWERLVGPTELVVRRFERASFVEGSLFQDFFEAAGIDARADDLDDVETQNESLDAEAVEFLRLYNLYRLEHAGGRGGLIHNRSLVTRLAQHATGPTLTMPDSFLDEFMANWEESNQRVAREILGEESGELFRTPRKSRNTTTVQQLDPARLDHFINLLELPEHVHEPLRRLVELEAVAR